MGLKGLGTWLGGLVARLLRIFFYDCYRQILEGGEVPTWFNRSTLVFIPKGDPGAGGVGVQARPGDLRPLSLGNADQKLVALAINLSLSRVCGDTVHSAQRGFRRVS